MNPLLDTLQPYPFEKLSRLKHGIQPPGNLKHIALSIGEPQHATPPFIGEALAANFSLLTQYPTTRGLPELREGIAGWLSNRFHLPSGAIDPETQVLPCSGTREALFAFAQAVIDPNEPALVLMPNPFYQIYEGAALLAGAQPYFLNTTQASDYLPDFDAVPDEVWAQCQLLYICSPGNPSGAVITTDTQRKLIELADRFDFIIASDECYSELYNDESSPPPGLLESAWAMGNHRFRRCVVFHSLSKRSNAPGLRSGFVAGDADILSRFLLYRTYHGAAVSVPVQRASLAAWQDEAHVIANRALYRAKFAGVSNILGDVLDITVPPASFYLWPRIAGDDEVFARELFAAQNLTVLPGSYLSRSHFGINPGRHHLRMALVAPLEDCLDAAHRIRDFIQSQPSEA